MVLDKTLKNRSDLLSSAKTKYRNGLIREAMEIYREILDVEQNNAQALIGLAKMSLDLDNLNGAASLILRAMSVAPEDKDCQKIVDQVFTSLVDIETQAQFLFESSQILKENNLWDDALVRHRQALRLNPKLAQMDDFDSLSLLSKGDLEQGWKSFEWRNTIGTLGPFTDIVWSGEDLSQKTLLIWGEQGIGDQIMFSTCLPDIIENAAKVIFATDERLVPLFKRSFPNTIIHGVTRFGREGQTCVQSFDWLKKFTPIDFFILQGSLPRFVRPSLESFPLVSPRLIACSERRDYWDNMLNKLGPGKKIGISWRSILIDEYRSSHYPAIEDWKPLFNLKNVQFINLQAEISEEEIKFISDECGVNLHIFSEIDLIEDVDDLAALCESLDCIVTTLGSIQWLGAAIGTPVWSVALGQKNNHWNLLGQDHYPWFPDLNISFAEDTDVLDKKFRQVANEVSLI